MKCIFLFILLFFPLNSYSQVIINMKRQGGVYTVPCKVNGLNLKFIFDTGADAVSISLTEAIFMVKNNYLSEKEIYGTSYARIANGEITENTQILLREIEIAGIKIYNTRAFVIHNLQAPLLLGLSAIEKLGPIQFEGNKLIILNSKLTNPKNENTNLLLTNKLPLVNVIPPESYSNYYSYTNTYYSEVFTCAPIYNEPDMIEGVQIEQACEGNVKIIGKVGDDYYYISYGKVNGYVSKAMIKK